MSRKLRFATVARSCFASAAAILCLISCSPSVPNDSATSSSIPSWMTARVGTMAYAPASADAVAAIDRIRDIESGNFPVQAGQHNTSTKQPRWVEARIVSIRRENSSQNEADPKVELESQDRRWHATMLLSDILPVAPAESILSVRGEYYGLIASSATEFSWLGATSHVYRMPLGSQLRVRRVDKSTMAVQGTVEVGPWMGKTWWFSPANLGFPASSQLATHVDVWDQEAANCRCIPLRFYLP
jgi:hypothetical protein